MLAETQKKIDAVKAAVEDGMPIGVALKQNKLAPGTYYSLVRPKKKAKGVKRRKNKSKVNNFNPHVVNIPASESVHTEKIVCLIGYASDIQNALKGLL